MYLWCVAGASVATRLILRESPRDISFRWNGRLGSRAMLIGTALPLVVALTSYGIGWGIGLAHFATAAIPHATLGIAIAGSPIRRFCTSLFINLTVGSLWGCRLSAGEEIGWRGYMLTRLMRSRLSAPIGMSGFIWGLWHLPLILGGEYTSVPRSIFPIALFVTDITALGYVFAWLRLSSGSIWPCVWAHAVWNQMVMVSFGGVTDGGVIWVGEAGLLTTSIVILSALVLYRVWPLPVHAAGDLTPKLDQIGA